MGLMTSRPRELPPLRADGTVRHAAGPPRLPAHSGVPGSRFRRGPRVEESIRLDYLNRLNERYEAWISTYTKGKVLVINVDNMDFEHNPEQLGDIITKVDAELNGLF